MRHSKARNVIERAFAVLKMRWGILRSASFYPIQTQIRLIMACFLLHNFIRREMSVDPLEDALAGDASTNIHDDNYVAHQYIDVVEPSQEWTALRDTMAMNMWNSR